MTQTMRERLEAVAARTATVDLEGGYEVDNWPEVIAAILAELRVPDEEMLKVLDPPPPGMPSFEVISSDPRERFAKKFAAMIDAVRVSKTTP